MLKTPTTTATTATAKKLINLLYKEAATSTDTSQAIPRITRQLYNDPDSDLDADAADSTTNNDLLSTYQTTKRKLPATEALKTGPHISTPSNILSFKCINLFITKQDFKNLLPKEHQLTYSLNPINNFEMVKRRSGPLLQFQNEYILIFKSHLNAKIFQLETQGKLINGIQFRTEFQCFDDIIDDLVPEKLRVANHESLIHEIESLKQYTTSSSSTPNASLLDQIKSLKQHHIATSSSSTPSQFEPIISCPLYDESYPILTHLINAPNRAKSILIHNWPFGLKKDLVIESLWNYNLSRSNGEQEQETNSASSPPPIEPIYSNVIQGINLIKMNFMNEYDALRFIRNFHGTKWLKLQNFRKVEEKVSPLPLLCETL